MTRHGLLHVADWYPTIVEGLAGGRLEEGEAIDGVNQVSSGQTDKPSASPPHQSRPPRLMAAAVAPPLGGRGEPSRRDPAHHRPHRAGAGPDRRHPAGRHPSGGLQAAHGGTGAVDRP